MDLYGEYIVRMGPDLIGASLQLWWQSLIIVGLLFVLIKAMPQLNAATRYVLWCMGLVGIMGLGVGNLIGPPAGMEAIMERPRDTTILGGVMPHGAVFETTDLAQVRGQNSTAVDKAPKWLERSATWPQFALAAWLMVSVLMLGRIVLSYRYMCRLKREGQPLAARLRLQLKRGLINRPSGRCIQWRQLDGIASPMAVGLLHPVVLFPAQLITQMDTRNLRQIALHEVAHIRRWDDWTNLLQQTTLALLWWMPAVWWVGRQMDLQREIACDDWVVERTDQRRSYARCLTWLVEAGQGLRKPILASGAVRDSHLFTRVKLLVDTRRPVSTRIIRAKIGVGGVLIGLCLLGLAACENPFAPPRVALPQGRAAAPPATSPEQWYDNLSRAFNERDKDLYETLVDEEYWFTETDCRGELIFSNDREEEIRLLLGSRDGEIKGMFDQFRVFEFDFQLIERSIEYGRDFPDNFVGDPDGHPEEDWQVFRGRSQMLMTDGHNNGFRVDQLMNFKLRQNEAGLWKVIRWVDDPLSGDCGTAKVMDQVRSWTGVKRAQS